MLVVNMVIIFTCSKKTLLSHKNDATIACTAIYVNIKKK